MNQLALQLADHTHLNPEVLLFIICFALSAAGLVVALALVAVFLILQRRKHYNAFTNKRGTTNGK